MPHAIDDNLTQNNTVLQTKIHGEKMKYNNNNYFSVKTPRAANFSGEETGDNCRK